MRSVLWSVLLLMAAAVPLDGAWAQAQCNQGAEVRQLLQEIEELTRMAQMYQNAGLGNEYMQTRSRIIDRQSRLPRAYLDQELRMFPLTRDTRCLMLAFNAYTGVNASVQPRPDGTWDMLVNGVVTQEGLTNNELLALLRQASE